MAIPPIPPIPPIKDHTKLSNIGSYSHDAIDTHLDSNANPHAVNASQVITEYSPTGIEFGNTNQSYDIDGEIWVNAVSGGTLGGIPDETIANHKIADCLSAIQSALDGSYLVVRESAGTATATNPMTVQFLFSGVTNFTSINLRTFYEGSPSHTSHIQLWNYTTSSFDTYATYYGELDFLERTHSIFNPTDYISGGNVILQFIHTSYGRTLDHLEIDFIKLIDGLGGGGTVETGYVRNTHEETINVSNSTELASAFSNLSAAPSLLGNINVVLGTGTYADAVIFPSLIGNGYKLIVSGGTSNQLSDTATGGSAGTRYIQGYVTQSGASYTVDAYRGMFIEFTSGTNNGEVRIVERNSATQIDLMGQFLPATPANGDTFIIYSNDSEITGDITINPTAVEINITNLNLGNLIANNANLLKLEETDQTLTGYNENKISGSTLWYRNRVTRCSSDGVVGLWTFGSIITMDSSLMIGNTGYTWGWLVQGGGHVLIRNGSIMTNFDNKGLWVSIGGTAQCNPTSSYDSSKVTETIAKKCNIGIGSDGGGCILTDSIVFGSGGDANTTDKSPAGASDPAWIT